MSTDRPTHAITSSMKISILANSIYPLLAALADLLPAVAQAVHRGALHLVAEVLEVHELRGPPRQPSREHQEEAEPRAPDVVPIIGLVDVCLR